MGLRKPLPSAAGKPNQCCEGTEWLIRLRKTDSWRH